MHYLGRIIVLILFCSQLWGLNPDTPAKRYLVNQWKSQDVIPSNTILAINQTEDGYLWLATSKGLLRYDGIKFSIIDFTGAREENQDNPLPDALFVDKKGILWIGSSSGLTSYRYQTGEFFTYTEADGITKDRVRRIQEDAQGNLWISFFASYLNRFSEGKFTKFNASHGLKGKKINAIIEDKKGNLLFGTREYGVFVFHNGKFSPFQVTGLENLDVIAMYEDTNGVLWIGTNNGLFRVTDRVATKYTIDDGLSNDYITSFLEDSEENLWIGTFKGLNRVTDTQAKALEFEPMLEEDVITCLFEDREKCLWVGTNEEGVKQIRESRFFYLDALKAYEKEVFLSLFEDSQGDTWIGTFSGRLFRYRSGRLWESPTPRKLNGAGIVAITVDERGTLWLGTNGKGAFKRETDTYTQLTTQQGLADNLVTSIFCDSRGDVWFSTFDGVSKLNPGNNKMETLNSQNGLSGKVAHNVYEMSSGDIWIAADKGITVLKGGNIIKGENLKYFLEGVDVTCLLEDNSVEKAGSVVWLATHGAGLKRLTLSEGKIFSFTTAEGMTSNFLYQFFIDRKGNFWFMSDSGILRVNKEEFEKVVSKDVNMLRCISFGVSDGLKSQEFDNEFSRHSALKSRENEFWFVNKGGIVTVNPDKIQIDNTPPPVVIEKVLFNGEPVSLHDGDSAFVGVKELYFYFTAPSFISPVKIKFKYKLEGENRDWVDISHGNPRFARYYDLGSGQYVFRVTACNAEGVWNPVGASFSFIVESRFYETLFFKIILTLLIIGLLSAGIFYNKKHSLKKKEKYKGSPLTPQFADECIKKLRHLMEVEKKYRDAELSLQLLAEKLSVSPHILSQILNEKLNRNFSDFINFYRIEDAKSILASPQGAEKKIIVIAFDVGFNTKVAFYNAFKKYTGMTPAEYRKNPK